MLAACAATAQAQTSPPGEEERRATFPPRVEGQAVLMTISARVMEQDRVESWNEHLRQVTISGRAVEIKLVGANLILAMQFTPYVRRGEGSFLVAQGQIWVSSPDHGVRYHASMQMIPLQFGEPIYFFPLGPVREDSASIEMILTMHLYEGDSEH